MRQDGKTTGVLTNGFAGFKKEGCFGSPAVLQTGGVRLWSAETFLTGTVF